ncbi:zinc finger protein 800 [Eurytemora carolleeae]|uniref:zinc finger protein 800 n=1 Tax=Eurytemora carolleeae TaxID=1294199 RepID=UPI000C76BDEC|nr:zinc finger protein 800 [Eurytemora carolleeae]|eukprot:XP_023331337.1 zinc finger protein 800-like [Eurytemora affinis]
MLALESATLEVKRYMLDEASIIYECKTCNNMFRSLGNLIAHKRTFCNSRYSQIKHIYSDKVGKDFASSQTVFIENEKVETVVPEEPFDLQAYSPSLNLLKEAEILRELKVEPARSRLLPPRKEGLQRIVDRLAARIEPSERNDILLLEPMVENSSAVFQTLATIETTGMDVKQLSRDKSETVVVAPSGLPLTKGSLPNVERPCSPCSSDNSKENNEVEKVWRYPCPICKGKRVYYSKIFTVYKHIERHHNKSLDEAKLMRKKIKVKIHKNNNLSNLL